MLEQADRAFAQTGWQQEARVRALPSGANCWVQVDREEGNTAVAHEAVGMGLYLGESRDGAWSSDTAAYNDGAGFATVGDAQAGIDAKCVAVDLLPACQKWLKPLLL